MRRNNKFSWLLMLALGLLLSGCYAFQPKVQLKDLALDVEINANNDLPIAVDFVTVLNDGLLERLLAISAQDWFAQKTQLELDHRGEIFIWGVELVPGQFMRNKKFPLAGKSSAGLLVFARYQNPGVHRMRLDGMKSAWLRFDNREMHVVNAVLR